jgi:type IV secretion system protein VirB3
VTRLAQDPIFAALTRPQMIFGVTYNYAVFNLIATVEIFLLTKSFWALAATAIVHAIGYVACVREPRFFGLWIMKVSSCPRVRNYRYWRCNSYQP